MSKLNSPKYISERFKELFPNYGGFTYYPDGNNQIIIKFDDYNLPRMLFTYHDQRRYKLSTFKLADEEIESVMELRKQLNTYQDMLKALKKESK